VDLAFGFATDGRIDSYGLEVLEDDQAFFPPYQAAPVVRIATLRAYPELRDALELLGNLLSDPTMRRLNRESEEGGRTVGDVAADFLASTSVLGTLPGPR
jgi:glycine betaine/choline ABC-type transport system substrate-binding protein